MSSLPGLCDRAVRWGLVGLIAFTPLAFGTVEPWAVAMMEWGVVTLMLLFALGRLWPSREGGVKRVTLTGLEIPIALFLLLGALQTVPLPMSWLRVISPGSARLYRPVDLRAASEAVRPGSANDRPDDRFLNLEYPERRPVSVRPPGTWARVRLVAVLSGLMLLVAWWADRGQRIVFVLTALTVTGFLVAVFGLVQFLTWNGKIYWVRKVPPSSPFGPFVNHNHFAGYVEMIIPVAISLAFYLIEIRRRRVQLPAAPSDPGDPETVGSGGSDDKGWGGKVTLALFAAIILVVSLFFSLSRGGIASAVASGLILFVLLRRRLASRRVGWAVALALPLLAVMLILWIGADVVKRQLGTYQSVGSEASFRLRVRVWDRLIHGLPDYLWVGSGMGAFEESFAPVTPRGLMVRWDKAHNDYLQILWETGVAGAAIILLGGFVFVRRYWWPAIHGRAHPLDLFRLAVAVSLMSIALHSVVDFNLQIGSNAFLCALLTGLLISLHHVVGKGPAERPVLVQNHRDGP